MDLFTSATGSGPKMINWPNKWAVIQEWAGWESGPWARTGWNHRKKKSHSQEQKSGIWQGRHSAKANQVNTREAGRKQILEAQRKIKYNLAKRDRTEATYRLAWLACQQVKAVAPIGGHGWGQVEISTAGEHVEKGGVAWAEGAGQKTVTRPKQALF